MKWIQLSRMTPETWEEPRYLIVYTTQPYEALPIAALRERFPELVIMGVSSHHGIFTSDGFKRGSFGVLFEGSDDHRLNVRLIQVETSAAARQKVVDCIQGMPALSTPKRQFMINATPGFEERILEGFSDVFGDDVDVYGGSAGNDRFLDMPYIFLNEEMSTKGVLICEMSEYSVCNSTTMAGYLLTQKRGVVTRAAGRRIYEIDHRLATEVYDAWTDNMFTDIIKAGATFPRSAARFPLGRILEKDTAFEVWLTHVYGVENNALCVYSEIAEGTEVCLMRGSRERIFENLKRSVELSLNGVDRTKVRGAFLNLCAGCMNLISENMEQFNQAVCDAFGNIPLLGFSSCGEQGTLPNESCHQHGNMMVNITLLK